MVMDIERSRVELWAARPRNRITDEEEEDCAPTRPWKLEIEESSIGQTLWFVDQDGGRMIVNREDMDNA